MNIATLAWASLVGMGLWYGLITLSMKLYAMLPTLP